MSEEKNTHYIIEIKARVMYIRVMLDAHYVDKITYSSIIDEFSVSTNTVNKLQRWSLTFPNGADG